jgi:putative transposase
MAGYIWRQLTEAQRADLLQWRKKRENPWHGPPHPANFQRTHFHLTAACYEHAPLIGKSADRIQTFSEELIQSVATSNGVVHGYCVLPNHYHLLVETENILKVIHALGRLHGRISRAWNSEDQSRGRKVFFGVSDRAIRSDRHFWATLNYIHNNPIHHGYVNHWQEWPWSSGANFLAEHGRAETERIWRAYPVREYGAGWDDANF